MNYDDDEVPFDLPYTITGNTNDLTAHQKDIFDGIIREINNMKNNVISLTGQAGVGKTYVTGKLISYLVKHYPDKVIVATAPTHKALNVIRQNLLDVNIETKTIHSFLNLKLTNNYENGMQELLANTKYDKREICDLLIIDESSMISYELVDFLESAVDDGRVKQVLMIGDKNQLLPPADNETTDDIPLVHIDSEYNLKEIVRQAADNTIIQKADKLRELIENKDFKDLRGLFDDIDHNDQNIKIVNSLHEMMKHYFNNDTDDKIVAAYTNNKVDSYNTSIRNYNLKSQDNPYLLAGDVIVLDGVYKVFDDIVHRNGAVLEVERAELLENDNVKYWKVWVKEGDPIKVIDIHSKKAFKKKLSDIAKEAKKSKTPRKIWKEFYSLKEEFVDFKYNFASTCHKLQGSDYDYVYIDFTNICKYQDFGADTMYRLIYVALTRARKQAIIYV